MKMEKIRILIVDDHPVFRFGLSSLILSIPDMEVIGEAISGETAIEQAANLQPDIILMDINMPGLNGIEATRQILEKQPDIGILVITMFDDDSVFDAMQAGARGYILKGADPEETVRAIHSVAKGAAIFSPKIAERLITYFGRNKDSMSSETFPELTDREREILELIAQGLTNPAIADRLVLSPKTVRNHVSNIFSKLQVSDRAQAIIKARQAGMGNPN
jgi:DNA-binding NarL/FixJ family response regulator